MSWTDEKAKNHPLFNESADEHMKRGFEFLLHGLLLTMPRDKFLVFEKLANGHVRVSLGGRDLASQIETADPITDYAPGAVNFLRAIWQLVAAIADTLDACPHVERDQLELLAEVEEDE